MPQSMPATRCLNLRVVIVEPFSAGHRPSYVRWSALAFLSAGIDVTIVGSESLIRHPEIEELQSARENQKENSCVAIAIDAPAVATSHRGRFGQWRFELRMRKWLETAYAAARPSPRDDIVFVPYLDYCFHATAVLGSPFGATPWCGITMRTEFVGNHDQTSAQMKARHVLLRRILANRTTRAIFSIDPRSETELRRRSNNPRYSKLQYLPDPAELESLPNYQQARSELGIAPQEKVLLLFGSIDLRKGLAEMIRGVMATPNPTAWRVIVAGKKTQSAVEALARWREIAKESDFSIYDIDGVVASCDIPRLFASADVVWVAYPGHKAMSGVLIQAAFAGKPVIAQSQTLIGDLVSDAGIGIACDVHQPRAVAAALEDAISPALRNAARAYGPVRFRDHTPKMFGARVLQAAIPPQARGDVSATNTDLLPAQGSLHANSQRPAVRRY
jgi:glycosyltransferase involved in cell wall biosynthesis